jgi:hypothetical protein
VLLIGDETGGAERDLGNPERDVMIRPAMPARTIGTGQRR